ncbi:hypothetical protein HGRIS_010624 [Hohenbuehelia grisea]
MSRALGAAFLNHQVEQLEKTVSTGSLSGNWRDRKQHHGNGSFTRGAAPRRPQQQLSAAKAGGRRRGGEYERDLSDVDTVPVRQRRSQDEDLEPRKDADVIVVDASVLIYALQDLKKWCREGRKEIVIVPLEALNTLDLLKKGTTPLAQRARAASRILEAQVGTNSRIRVQSDKAYVLWDEIDWNEDTDVEKAPSPEWVRRTICCARYEAEQPLPATEPPTKTSDPKKPRVVLAAIPSAPSLSPKSLPKKLDTPLTPVPLPAPTNHANKHEPRAAGSLIVYWAKRAGIELLECKPSEGNEDEERHTHSKRGSGGSRGRRLSQNGTMGGPHRSPGLVERPPAVMAMMEMVSQPSKTVRLLARGEKLDPDP